MNSWQVLIVDVVCSSAVALGALVLEESHEGKVVSVMNRTLVMVDVDGTNHHTHTVARDAAVMRDGRPSELTDLQPGDFVHVTLAENGGEVQKIEARSGMVQISTSEYRDEVRDGYLR